MNVVDGAGVLGCDGGVHGAKLKVLVCRSGSRRCQRSLGLSLVVINSSITSATNGIYTPLADSTQNSRQRGDRRKMAGDPRDAWANLQKQMARMQQQGKR